MIEHIIVSIVVVASLLFGMYSGYTLGFVNGRGSILKEIENNKETKIVTEGIQKISKGEIK